MNPVTKLMSWLRGPTSDPESRAEARRLREDRDTIRISQESSVFGVPTNVPPTPKVLDPGSEDSHKSG
jgi:hypothetical protein